jgi:hypothetical protein
VKTIYDYAYLAGRQNAGVPLSGEEAGRLRGLRAALEYNGPERRSHRRQISALPVLLKTSSGIASGFVRNLSGGGMLIQCSEALPVGSRLRARLGSTGETEYTFSCRVVRQETSYYGLKFEGIPLEIRYGSYPKTLERTGTD